MKFSEGILEINGILPQLLAIKNEKKCNYNETRWVLMFLKKN